MKRFMNWMRKRVFLSVVIILLIGGSATAFAYWAGLIRAPTDEVEDVGVTIGQGEDVNTEILEITLVDRDNQLVPDGYSGVSEEIWQTNVNWVGVGATGALGTLNISYELSHATLTPAELASMFSVTFTPNNTAITAGTALEVEIKLVFENEPADLTMYNQIVNSTITITVTFNVDPN